MGLHRRPLRVWTTPTFYQSAFFSVRAVPEFGAYYYRKRTRGDLASGEEGCHKRAFAARLCPAIRPGLYGEASTGRAMSWRFPSPSSK